MTDIRKSLEQLADSIESLQNQPTPTLEINDRSLSGDKINGGTITNFASLGIKDEARRLSLIVKDDGIHADAIYVKVIPNKLQINGNLNVKGEIFAEKLSVNEISADIRNERTSPLEFKGENQSAYGKGLVWTGGSYTKQFILQGNEDRLWSTEHIDLNQDKEYRINNVSVLSSTALGGSVTKSNLKSLGTLDSLRVAGSIEVDNFLKYDSKTQRFSLGADEANGMLALESLDHQFVIDPTANKKWKIGTYTTSDLQIITDDTTRITVEANGGVILHSKTTVQGKVGIGVKNFAEDADLTVAGPIRFANKKFEVSDGEPTHGSYAVGDIVWNSNPQPTGYVGWVCVREGTPGIWKPFGQISN